MGQSARGERTACHRTLSWNSCISSKFTCYFCNIHFNAANYVGSVMADRKMMMMTDNHGRRHGISYIMNAWVRKGQQKIHQNPADLKINSFVTYAQCLNLPTVTLSLILNVYKFFLKQYNAILTQTYLIISQYHHHTTVHELHRQGDNQHQAHHNSWHYGNISLTP